MTTLHQLTPIGATFSTNLSSWLFAVPGSPNSSKLMSPRRVRPSGSLLRDPPINRHAIALFMSILPYIEGDMDLGGRGGEGEGSCFPTHDVAGCTLLLYHRRLDEMRADETPPLPQRSEVFHWLCRGRHCPPQSQQHVDMASSTLHCLPSLYCSVGPTPQWSHTLTRTVGVVTVPWEAYCRTSLWSIYPSL